jgi:dihydrolipoamide dehydrogenase
MSDIKCKLLIIGAGPGGYVCAIRAGQLGIDTVVVDAGMLGGTCLNIGCIPSKALIHAADEFHAIANISQGPLGITTPAPSIDLAKTMAWKNGIVDRLTSGVDHLMRQAKVRIVNGHARFTDGKTVEVAINDVIQTIRAEQIVIATGSSPIELPFMPFGGDVLSSTEALELTEIPKTLAIVGGGYIGLELGTAYAKLGSTVTIVEAAESILPTYDKQLTQPVAKRLKQLGITVSNQTKALSYKKGVLKTDQGDLDAAKVLVTVGRRPNTEGLGLTELSLTQKNAFIQIDERCQTSMRGIYAIGDVTGEPMLAHRAMAQGEMVAELVGGNSVEWDKRAIPAVCFTDPQIVTCGAMPSEIEGTKSVQFPFSANGRSMTSEREDGFIRVVWRESDRAILGIQAVGADVAEMSAGFALAIEMGARVDDIGATIHAHPTQSEALQEACLRALGKAIHI